MRDADYIYAVASIRAKEKSLLNDSDIQTMVGMKTGEQVLSYLTERGWGEGANVKDAEAVLEAEETKNMELLEKLHVDPYIIEVLSYPELYHNLKAAVKVVCTGTEHSEAFYDSDVLDEKMLVTIIRDNEFEKLPEHMQAVAKDAKEVMLSTRDGQKCDIKIDRACLDATELAAASKDKFLSEYAETKVAITDIKIAVRAAITHRSLEFIQSALAPCKSFDVELLADAAASGIEDVYTFLEKHGFKDAVDAIKESYSVFERWCDDYIMSTLMGQKTNIQSSGPIVAYYLARQNEIRTARIIITAKANGFSESVISERVRKMYG